LPRKQNADIANSTVDEGHAGAVLIVESEQTQLGANIYNEPHGVRQLCMVKRERGEKERNVRTQTV
jgi:hypothetical protein